MGEDLVAADLFCGEKSVSLGFRPTPSFAVQSGSELYSIAQSMSKSWRCIQRCRVWASVLGCCGNNLESCSKFHVEHEGGLWHRSQTKGARHLQCETWTQLYVPEEKIKMTFSNDHSSYKFYLEFLRCHLHDFAILGQDCSLWSKPLYESERMV